MENLNPCPLKACCNVWGQCGISKGFCLGNRGPLNNPGTAPPGTNGCISSCGTEIIKGATTLASFGRVGYYESWNMKRPCATLKAEYANTDGSYTITHCVFMEINTADWTVRFKHDYKQWEGFKKLTAKKVISFGGWAFSNEMPTYEILGQATSPNNRDKFAANSRSFSLSKFEARGTRKVTTGITGLWQLQLSTSQRRRLPYQSWTKQECQ